MFRLHKTIAMIALACSALIGCTVQRLQHDTAQGLEWLRLKHATRIDGASRWQLPRGARIRVEQTAPAPDPAWLSAAQLGVDAVFPAQSADSAAGPGSDFRLLVSWPRAGAAVPPGPEVSLWEIVDMDQFLPDFAQPMALRVALVRDADGALVEAAELRVTPHWFTAQAQAPRLVHGAFRDFAEQFSARY